MKLSQIVDALALTVSAGSRGLDAEVTGGYSSDMLSCAMAGAAQGNLWVTLQGHLNVVAVAALNDLAGVIVTEGKSISPEALAKADDEGIPMLTTRQGTFEVCGRLWELLKVAG
jgi:predicted transcriptional regulator